MSQHAVCSGIRALTSPQSLLLKAPITRWSGSAASGSRARALLLHHSLIPSSVSTWTSTTLGIGQSSLQSRTFGSTSPSTSKTICRSTSGPVSQRHAPSRIAQKVATCIWRPSRYNHHSSPSSALQQVRLSSSWNPKPRQSEDITSCPSCNRRFKSDDSLKRSRDAGEEVKRAPPTQPSSSSQVSTTQAHDHGKQQQHHHSHLLDRLPHIHRPTKEELLAAATGFWQRLAVRFKWFSIKSARPFNTDDISAFISWLIAAHLLWIILGTTTFVSIAVLAINSIFAQGMYTRLSCIQDIRPLLIQCLFRNSGWMDRQLPHQVHWRQSRLRVGRCAQMEGRRHHFQERLRL